MHYIFEVSMRDWASEEAVKAFLAMFFDLPINMIVEKGTYFNEEYGDENRVGCRVVHEEHGLATGIFLITYEELNADFLCRLGKEMSKHFCSEVILGDFRDEMIVSAYRFLSFLPDGETWECVDNSSGSVYEVAKIAKIKL